MNARVACSVLACMCIVYSHIFIYIHNIIYGWCCTFVLCIYICIMYECCAVAASRMCVCLSDGQKRRRRRRRRVSVSLCIVFGQPHADTSLCVRRV